MSNSNISIHQFGFVLANGVYYVTYITKNMRNRYSAVIEDVGLVEKIKKAQCPKYGDMMKLAKMVKEKSNED